MMYFSNHYNRRHRQIMILAIAACIWMIVTSCNPYKQIAKRIPTNSKDSSRLLHAALSITQNKPDTGILKPGVVITLPDSSEYFKEQVDSIRATKTKVIEKLKIQWRDTCETIIDDSFGEGEKFGFQEGYAKGKSDCPTSTNQVDTIFKISDETALKINEMQVNIGSLLKENVTLTSQRDIYKTEKRNYFWMFVIASSIGLGAVMLWIKNKFSNPAKLIK